MFAIDISHLIAYVFNLPSRQFKDAITAPYVLEIDTLGL
jgi:hypothetical protein